MADDADSQLGVYLSGTTRHLPVGRDYEYFCDAVADVYIGIRPDLPMGRFDADFTLYQLSNAQLGVLSTPGVPASRDRHSLRTRWIRSRPPNSCLTASAGRPATPSCSCGWPEPHPERQASRSTQIRETCRVNRPLTQQLWQSCADPDPDPGSRFPVPPVPTVPVRAPRGAAIRRSRPRPARRRPCSCRSRSRRIRPGCAVRGRVWPSRPCVRAPRFPRGSGCCRNPAWPASPRRS